MNNNFNKLYEILEKNISSNIDKKNIDNLKEHITQFGEIKDMLINNTKRL